MVSIILAPSEVFGSSFQGRTLISFLSYARRLFWDRCKRRAASPAALISRNSFTSIVSAMKHQFSIQTLKSVSEGNILSTEAP